MEHYSAKTEKTGCGRIYKVTSDKPFASGCNRHAFLAVITEGPCKGQKGVVKVFIDSKRRGQSHDILTDIKLQSIAKKYASQFSDILKDDHLLKVRQSELIKIEKTYYKSDYFKAGDYVAVERYIPAKWKRWTTCFGQQSIHSDLLNAFEHFVYAKSNGKRMICDLQGGQKDGKYVLTDPTLSSTIDHGIPLNGKQKTIDIVMKRHKCNLICKKLNLKQH